MKAAGDIFEEPILTSETKRHKEFLRMKWKDADTRDDNTAKGENLNNTNISYSMLYVP